MRIIFLLFTFVFISTPSHLKGDYFETYHGMVGASWHFEKDGTFTYSEANCEGGRVGNGIYKLQGDSIHLIFHRAATSSIPSKLEAVKQKNMLPGWDLDFLLRDRETGEEIIFAQVIVRDAAGNKLKEAVTDINGRTMVRLPDFKAPIIITVPYLDYSTAELKLQNPGSYFIKGTMSQTFGPAGMQEGTRYDYRLLSVNKKGMQWQTTLPDTTIIIDVKKYNKR